MADDPRWTVIVPYYNERNYLTRTLETLVAQSFRDFRLVLVDNGSDDGSAALARRFMQDHDDIETLYVEERRKGKTAALAAGAATVRTEFLAFCDADTLYPMHYLATADRLMRAGGVGVVAVMAIDIQPPADGAIAQRRLRRRLWAARWLDWQTHTGGFGQGFRTAAYRAAGGYSPEIWPYVLEDHEVMNRILGHGRAVYDRDFWCMPSARRTGQTSWTLAEQLRYHATPFPRQQAFFHEFLAGRLRARNATALMLRERSWETG
jgi:glycosyltransferase involved in cell wall biosynthesis